MKYGASGDPESVLPNIAPETQPTSPACHTPTGGVPSLSHGKIAKWCVPGFRKNSHLPTARSVGLGTGIQRQPSSSSPGARVGPSSTSWWPPGGGGAGVVGTYSGSGRQGAAATSPVRGAPAS